MNCYFGAEGQKALAEGLLANEYCNIQRLDIKGNHDGLEKEVAATLMDCVLSSEFQGTDAIVNAVTVNKRLTSLRLSDCNFVTPTPYHRTSCSSLGSN